MRWHVVLLYAALICTAGCSAAGAQEHIRLTAEELPASAGLDATGEVWQSVAWRGDWHRYPGEAIVEVEHGLGRAPMGVLVYLSFQEDGESAGLATGDLARILEVTPTHVQIRNDTEADLYARIVLH